MPHRSARIALALVFAATLAACEGTTGTVEDPETGSASAPSDTAATSGAGSDAVSGTETAVAGAGDSATTVPDTAPPHPLDDPATPLSTRTIYFEFDSSDVPASAQAVIGAHATYLAGHSNASITLEGHADERGSREYNIGLGDQRANAVRRLMTLLGATSPQIRTVSYGEERPASAGHDESAWQLNRRVEIVYRVRE